MKHLIKFAASMTLTALAGLSGQAVVVASDVLVVMDFSGSMAEKTADGVRRIDAARAAIPKVTQILKNENVGLMMFGHRIAGQQPNCCDDIELKLPIAPIADATFSETVNRFEPLGATPLAASILKTREHLLALDQDSQKSIIVLTDGNDTCYGDPAAAARELRAAGINVEIHVVGLAVKKAEEAQLRSLAEAGGGKFVVAQNAAELESALVKMATASIKQTKIVEISRSTLVKDTFDGEELSAEWIVERPDGDRYAVFDGALLVISQFSAPWTEHAKLKNYIRRVNPVAASDFEVSVDLDMRITMQHHGAAIVLQQDENNYVELRYYGQPHGYNVWREFQIRKCVDGRIADWSRDYVIGKAGDAESVTLKIVKQGAVFTGYAKAAEPKTGKVDWLEVGIQAAPTLTKLTPVLKATNGASDHYGSGKVTEIDTLFDNFEVVATELERIVSGPSTEGAWFASDFDSAEKFANDFTVVNADNTHSSLGNGLSIITQPGNFRNEKEPLKNLVLLNRELPSGDYDIEVQVTARVTSQDNDFGMVLYQDDQNLIRVGQFGKRHGYNVDKKCYFEKVLKGKVNTTLDQQFRPERAKEDQTFLFRIEKRSRRYTAKAWAMNQDKQKMEWLELGTYSVLRLSPKLGFMATNRSRDTYGSGQVHEINVRYDRVVIRER